jgi:hypothetical protein
VLGVAVDSDIVEGPVSEALVAGLKGNLVQAGCQELIAGCAGVGVWCGLDCEGDLDSTALQGSNLGASQEVRRAAWGVVQAAAVREAASTSELLEQGAAAGGCREGKMNRGRV